MRILKILNREEISLGRVTRERLILRYVAGELAAVVDAMTRGCADDDVIQRQTRASLDIARDIQVSRQQRHLSA